jgi:hypothetical protein
MQSYRPDSAAFSAPRYLSPNPLPAQRSAPSLHPSALRKKSSALIFSQSQIHAPILGDDNALVADIIMHLQENAPDIAAAYPPGYLVQIVKHSTLIARDTYGLMDVQAIRLFVALRWETGAGYFQHPTIHAALSDRSRAPMDRFAWLLTPENEHVWLEAEAYDGAEYWRGDKSLGFGGAA